MPSYIWKKTDEILFEAQLQSLYVHYFCTNWLGKISLKPVIDWVHLKKHCYIRFLSQKASVFFRCNFFHLKNERVFHDDFIFEMRHNTSFEKWHFFSSCNSSWKYAHDSNKNTYQNCNFLLRQLTQFKKTSIFLRDNFIWKSAENSK